MDKEQTTSIGRLVRNSGSRRGGGEWEGERARERAKKERQEITKKTDPNIGIERERDKERGGMSGKGWAGEC